MEENVLEDVTDTIQVPLHDTSVFYFLDYKENEKDDEDKNDLEEEEENNYPFVNIEDEEDFDEDSVSYYELHRHDEEEEEEEEEDDEDEDEYSDYSDNDLFMIATKAPSLIIWIPETKKITEFIQNKECPISYLPFSIGCHYTSCNSCYYLFDYVSIATWLHKSNKCPLCIQDWTQNKVYTNEINSN